MRPTRALAALLCIPIAGCATVEQHRAACLAEMPFASRVEGEPFFDPVSNRYWSRGEIIIEGCVSARQQREQAAWGAVGAGAVALGAAAVAGAAYGATRPYYRPAYYRPSYGRRWR